MNRRKKLKTTDKGYFSAKAQLKHPCECGNSWVQLVRTRNEKEFGYQCLKYGRLALWDVPTKK